MSAVFSDYGEKPESREPLTFGCKSELKIVFKTMAVVATDGSVSRDVDDLRCQTVPSRVVLNYENDKVVSEWS